MIFEMSSIFSACGASDHVNRPISPVVCHDRGMLVESVPNYSEGRRSEVVDRLAAAVLATPGAGLLDRTSDASHNRSVLTLAGQADAVVTALDATVAVAIETIDMEVHAGEHPRIGAVDVVPFVPLGETAMADCVALARSFGQTVAGNAGSRSTSMRARPRDPTASDSRTSGAAATRLSGTRSRRTPTGRPTSGRRGPIPGRARWPSGPGPF
jgi:hypothetical protein